MIKKTKEKILVTGGAGFIGSHVVDLFLKKNYEVIVIDDLSSGNKANLNKNAKFYQVDINSPEIKNIFKEENPDYICHQAAQISVSYSVRKPSIDSQRNIMGLLNLLECASENKVKGVVFASSGGTVYGEPEKFPINEKVIFNPTSPYGISKMASEYYLRFFNNYYNLNYISLRYANVYGPRQDPYGEAGVIAIFIRKMINGEAPTINGDGEYVRDYVYVEDVANACLLSIKNMLKLAESYNIYNKNSLKNVFVAYNIGTGEGVSVNQLFSFLRKIVGFSMQANYGPPRPGDVRRNILECSMAKKYLGWEAKYNIQKGLQKTVEWFKLANNER
jgi:UDP-glucose 4-epimerase